MAGRHTTLDPIHCISKEESISYFEITCLSYASLVHTSICDLSDKCEPVVTVLKDLAGHWKVQLPPKYYTSISAADSTGCRSEKVPLISWNVLYYSSLVLTVNCLSVSSILWDYLSPHPVRSWHRLRGWSGKKLWTLADYRECCTAKARIRHDASGERRDED